MQCDLNRSAKESPPFWPPQTTKTFPIALGRGMVGLYASMYGWMGEGGLPWHYFIFFRRPTVSLAMPCICMHVQGRSWSSNKPGKLFWGRRRRIALPMDWGIISQSIRWWYFLTYFPLPQRPGSHRSSCIWSSNGEAEFFSLSAKNVFINWWFIMRRKNGILVFSFSLSLSLFFGGGFFICRTIYQFILLGKLPNSWAMYKNS